MVSASIMGVEAQVENWVWSCENTLLENYLNIMRDPLGPSGADPYPDLTLAESAVERLGGKILKYDELEHVEGRVY